MDKSEKFWNGLSRKYDSKAKDKTFAQILSRSKKFLNPDDVVLDFACATRLYSFQFSNSVKRIYAFDTSSGMIDLAKDEANKTGNTNIAFSQSTLFDEAYEEASFDVILAFNILLYFNEVDVKKIVGRMHKLLKPNGRIITSTACLKEKRTLIATISGSIIFLLQKLGILPYLRFLKIDELKQTVALSGFNIVEEGVLIEKPALEYFIAAEKSIS